MYLELLQQRYGRWIQKEAAAQVLAPVAKKSVKAIGAAAKSTAKRPMRYAGRSSPKVSATGGAAKRPTIIDAELVDDVVKPSIISRLKAFGKQHGEDIAVSAAGLAGGGATGYGIYKLIDSIGNPYRDRYLALEKATSPSAEQAKDKNDQNGWNWNDIGDGLTNYISSGKIVEHAIPAILAYMAGRAMN